MSKHALITGITGQDGSYLSELLLNKGYIVHGIIRRCSTDNLNRLKLFLKDGFDRLHLHYGDLTDGGELFRLIKKIQPDEIYNLAAQSHVGVSFDIPEYTANVDGLGTLRILEAMRTLELYDKTRFYQASTSELYGKVQRIPQDEETPFYPRSPYAIAKLYAYWTVVNYREAYNLYACNGILFNHESPLRGEHFVTRKITLGLTKISMGLQDILYMGNLDAKRDWGHARDFVEMQWRMLQQEKPEDFVISTGQQYSVRQFIELTASYLDLEIEWQGKELDEVGIDKKTGKVIVAIDPRFFRATEVDSLIGSSKKAALKLGWKPQTTFEELVKEMVDFDKKVVLDNHNAYSYCS